MYLYVMPDFCCSTVLLMEINHHVFIIRKWVCVLACEMDFQGKSLRGAFYNAAM